MLSWPMGREDISKGAGISCPFRYVYTVSVIISLESFALSCIDPLDNRL